MSYSMARGMGDNVGPAACGPGEEWDLTSLQCVTAGQAVTPVPPVDVTFPSLPWTQQPAPSPSTPNSPQPQPQPAATDHFSDALPWVVGGVAVLGLGMILSSGRR
jgi:hypothetical protein